MGSCVSVHKDPEAMMKLRFSIGSKNDKILIPSPVKEKPDTVNAGDPTVAVKSLRFPSAGSKDEAFFDSQPWLDSDCEDDFVSVNGDFTPSRGNTPVHHNFSAGPVLVNKLSVDEPPSPPDKKKRLSELFKESLRNDDYNDVDPEDTKRPNEQTTPYFSRATSGGSSERTPYRALGAEEKLAKSPQCCLPGLLSNRSFSERKKKTSPGPIEVA